MIAEYNQGKSMGKCSRLFQSLQLSSRTAGRLLPFLSSRRSVEEESTRLLWAMNPYSNQPLFLISFPASNVFQHLQTSSIYEERCYIAIWEEPSCSEGSVSAWGWKIVSLACEHGFNRKKIPEKTRQGLNLSFSVINCICRGEVRLNAH